MIQTPCSLRNRKHHALMHTQIHCLYSPMAKKGIPSRVELNFPSDIKKIPAAVTLAIQIVSTPRRPRNGFPLRQSRMELEMVAAKSTNTRLTSTSPLASTPVWWKSRHRLKDVRDWMWSWSVACGASALDSRLTRAQNSFSQRSAMASCTTGPWLRR